MTSEMATVTAFALVPHSDALSPAALGYALEASAPNTRRAYRAA
jgi:hypothetical protein